MGRKKKPSKSDNRGYSQGPVQPKQSTPALKQETHNQMKELLDHFSNSSIHQQRHECGTGPSNRFPSKLANIVSRLDELGFTEQQIEQTALELQYNITLENALDYLCLNADTLELPALFTDGSLREELNTKTTAESLVVVSNENKGVVKSDEIEFETNALAFSKAQEKKVKQNDDDEKQKQKEWLLRQYEYEEEEEAVAEEIAETKLDSESQSITPEEQELLEKEKELKDLQDDLGCDANNYMRSKHEIKALQNEAKKMKQQVDGLRRKVERIKRQQQKETEAEQAVVVDCNVDADEGECGGFFDLFGESQQNEEPVSASHQQQPTQPTELPDFTIPKGWTGALPEKELDAICRKRKLLKPKYTKLPRNGGFRLSVVVSKKQPPMEWEALSNDFITGSSIKDYLAIHALYAIDSTLPLHSMFPPAHRSLWTSWVQKRSDDRKMAKQEQDDTKQQRIDRLVSMIASLETDNLSIEHGKSEDGENVDSTADNWDSENVELVNNKASLFEKELTPAGKRLQTDFIGRQATAAYLKMQATRDNLPMASYRDQVLATVRENAVTILAAETGAGKTTQCPQFILEEALLTGRGDKTQILCTQPRRVAATSVAERVAEEMCDTLGNTVGYQIRMETKKSANTKLLFCTTGIVLRRLQDDPNLEGVTHILVDEVHERQQQTDVLLIILRQLLSTTRADLKVILMSATLDSELFCSFFNDAPLISVPGRTFPVHNYFLEDLLDTVATNHVIEEGSRCAKYQDSYTEQTTLSVYQSGRKRKEVVDLTSATDPIEVSSLYDAYSMATRRSMERVNEEIINYDLIEDVLKHLLIEKREDFGADLASGTGSILIFLPGFGEIKTLAERLEGSRQMNSRYFEIIPLHSMLSSKDQRKAFLPSKLRKIILSTNIAETSVTIPDVVCVIDTGRVKELRQSKRFLTSQLATDWCSKASAKQRSGRAGRVQSGICLKLYSSHTATKIMQSNSLPELQRVPLEEICLSILASGLAKNCSDFLSQAPQPPPSQNVKASLMVLHDIGAVVRDDETQRESLSPLGKHLAKLPVSVRCGKMLLLGCIFNCIDPILTIAASLSSQSPFSTFINDAGVAKAKQKAFSDPDSDFITYCNVWDAYSLSTDKRLFCRENYLNHVSLRDIGSARKQFLDLLVGIGFLDRVDDEKLLKVSSFNKQSKRMELVHAVITAGLYPNVARLEQHPGLDCKLWHKEEQLHFHHTSVNAKKIHSPSRQWVVFDEKFGTSKRTNVSTTAFIHPLALILFGGNVVVKHAERLVIVDEWIEIKMAAQTGVYVREIKKQLDAVLQRMIDRSSADDVDPMEKGMIDRLCKILTG